MPNRVRVASLSEMPSETGLVVEVDGQELALFRVGDEVFALENECPHKQGPLGDGDLDEDVVTCPWHAWQVNVRTGRVVYNDRLCSRTFPCFVEGGEVYVEVGDA